MMGDGLWMMDNGWWMHDAWAQQLITISTFDLRRPPTVCTNVKRTGSPHTPHTTPHTPHTNSITPSSHIFLKRHRLKFHAKFWKFWYKTTKPTWCLLLPFNDYFLLSISSLHWQGVWCQSRVEQKEDLCRGILTIYLKPSWTIRYLILTTFRLAYTMKEVEAETLQYKYEVYSQLSDPSQSDSYNYDDAVRCSS